MDHSDHSMGSDSGNDTTSSSSHMMMTFQTDSSTPLYSNLWTPTSGGAYAGTCIFLVILAIVARLLVAFKSSQETRWANQAAERRYIAVNGKEPLAERITRDRDAKQVVISENGVEENVFVVEKKTHEARPWRFSVDPVRAALDTVIVGVGYLLMLAVMTMNVGYFLSVLAGVFIGSLAVGRYSSIPEH
ncbi:unnamed protein product [Clonostachys rosea]|uniref:Copper transport protein n=1 Tax=Bionectria ochroleuca TaxID=29856 RepID=A0ABY6ULY8_BIOOC|nr:unnamed protein product [Clonostachys rosea]